MVERRVDLAPLALMSADPLRGLGVADAAHLEIFLKGERIAAELGTKRGTTRSDDCTVSTPSVCDIGISKKQSSDREKPIASIEAGLRKRIAWLINHLFCRFLVRLPILINCERLIPHIPRPFAIMQKVLSKTSAPFPRAPILLPRPRCAIAARRGPGRPALADMRPALAHRAEPGQRRLPPAGISPAIGACTIRRE